MSLRPDALGTVTREPAGIAKSSATIAGWTLVSRAAGFARVAVVAAVLGPTFYGNLYQTTNLIPNVLYEFLTGALFASLLVPPMVRHVDAGDVQSQRRLANGFLGVVLLGYGAVVAVTIVAAPWVVRLLTIGVDDPSVQAAQGHAGRILLILVMPQVLLYGLIGTAVAAQNAHGRFALAAASPALENIGVILTLLATAALFDVARDIRVVSDAQIIFLGVGSTCAVAVHAALQWWGSSRVGMRLVPRAGWRDPDVRQLVRLALPSLGFAAFTTVRYGGIFIVAGSIAGGVVAFQIALTFFYLPIALAARPVAAAVLPRLSRSELSGDRREFGSHYSGALSLTLFVIVPAAVALVGLAPLLARVVSFGSMAEGNGPRLIALSLMTMGIGVTGEAMFLLATQAFYARHDARTPFRAMACRSMLLFCGMAVALLLVDGSAVLVVLGLSIAVADVLGGAWLHHRLRRRIDGASAGQGMVLVRTAAAAVVAVIPARYVASAIAERADGVVGAGIGMAAGAVVGVPLYLALQHVARSPEVGQLLTGVGRMRRRPC